MERKSDIPTSTKKLAVEWMRDKVTTGEVAVRLGVKQTSQAIYKMGMALREACRDGLIK